MNRTSTKSIVDKFKHAQDRLVLQASDLSLKALSDMIDAGHIDISPQYQRRERWNSDRQSALIESFLLNVPIPPVYLAEEDFGIYSVIDGKQRLTAISRFLNEELALSSLEQFQDLGGYTFSQLPSELQNALRVRPYLRVITLLKQSDPRLKYEVFTRLNRGGEPLNPQEIRNVLFRGNLNNLIMELCENDFLRKRLKIKDQRSSSFQKMQDAEYVLRYFTLQDSWGNFSGSFRKSMDDFMSHHRDEGDEYLESLKTSFTRSISWCEKLWQEHAFKRPSGEGVWRDQFLAGMYDAQMVAVSECSDNELERALHNKESVQEATRHLFWDQNFDNAVRVATNTPQRVSYRIESVQDVLMSI